MKFAKILSQLTVLSMFVSTVNAAGPRVDGFVITWTEPGWHQVQVQGTYESVCQGGTQCNVPTGVYTVINHGSGERFEDILVFGIPSIDSNLPPAPVAKTGQIISYSSGDDGDLQIGTSVAGSRFEDDSNGSFTDNLTGLVWIAIPDCLARRDWFGAVDYANNLSAGGELCPELNDGSVTGDWRLPNIKELYSLTDLSTSIPVFADGIPFSYVGTFNQDPFDFYWSSSSFIEGPDFLAWALDGSFGEVDIIGKANVAWVWAVRNAR